MAAPISRPAEHSAHLGHLWWLSAGGCGNGLDDAAWAPVLEASEQIVPDVLRTLANAGVPGYAASAHPPGYRLRDLAREAARCADSAWR